MTASAEQDLIQQASAVIIDCQHPRQPRDGHVPFRLRGIPAATLLAIVERLPELEQCDQWVVSNAIRHEVGALAMMGGSAVTVANLLAFAPEVGAIGAAQPHADIRRVLLRGLREYADSPRTPRRVLWSHADYLHEPDAVRDSAAAFVLASHLTSVASHGSDEEWSLLDASWDDTAVVPAPDLLDVVQGHLADPHRVVETAMQRRTIDTDLLRALLDADTPAIAEGTL